MENLKEMTVDDLLRNPTGKGSAQMAARKFIIQDLDNRYMKLMINHNKQMDVHCFKSNDDYLIKVKVPAEKYTGLYYDVLIMLTPNCSTKEDTDSVKTDKTLNRYRLKLFSNSPNFMFTYTYVLNKNDMIVPIVKNKCSNIALTQAPTIKNPVESYGFEKSCYFACKYIKQLGLLNKNIIDQHLFKYELFKLQASIKPQETKMKEYRMIQQQQKSTSRKTTAKKTTKNKTKPKK